MQLEAKCGPVDMLDGISAHLTTCGHATMHVMTSTNTSRLPPSTCACLLDSRCAVAYHPRSYMVITMVITFQDMQHKAAALWCIKPQRFSMHPQHDGQPLTSSSIASRSWSLTGLLSSAITSPLFSKASLGTRAPAAAPLLPASLAPCPKVLLLVRGEGPGKLWWWPLAGDGRLLRGVAHCMAASMAAFLAASSWVCGWHRMRKGRLSRWHDSHQISRLGVLLLMLMLRRVSAQSVQKPVQHAPPAVCYCSLY